MITEQVRKLKSAPVALALAAGMLIALGGTFASAASSPDLSLCVSKTTGALRYAAVCKSTENRMTFNVVGPTGAQGETGPIGPTGAKGDTGSKGETGASGVEQVDVKTISYIHSSDQPGFYSVSGQDSCLDGSPKRLVGTSSDQHYEYCVLSIPDNKTAYVLNVTNTLTASARVSYPVMVPAPCSSIRFETVQQTTDEYQMEFDKQVMGLPPYGYKIPVRPNFDYANVRTTGLPLYPASGTRCLVFKTGYTYQNIELAETTWSIALVDKSS